MGLIVPPLKPITLNTFSIKIEERKVGLIPEDQKEAFLLRDQWLLFDRYSFFYLDYIGYHLQDVNLVILYEKTGEYKNRVYKVLETITYEKFVEKYFVELL